MNEKKLDKVLQNSVGFYFWINTTFYSIGLMKCQGYIYTTNIYVFIQCAFYVLTRFI